jgi:hypothetical protein
LLNWQPGICRREQPIEETAMEKTTHEGKSSSKHKAPIPHEEMTAREHAETTMANVWPKVTMSAGVVAAAGGGLLAAALLGVGPAALAGAAGYLAYRAMTRRTPAHE